MEFSVVSAEAVQVVGGVEIHHAVEPVFLFHLLPSRMTGNAQGFIDDFPGFHIEAPMGCAEAFGQRGDHIMIAARFGEGFDHLRADLQIHMAAAFVDVVMLEKRRGRQHDIGEGRGIGHELFVHTKEQVIPQQALAHLARFRRHHGGIGILHDHRGDGRPVADIARIVRQHRADA